MMRLALRNLARNRWRTGLTLAGVAVAVAMLVWSEASMDALLDTMVRSATAVQLGDVRVESAARARSGALQDAFPVSDALLDRIRAAPGVEAAAPRLVTFGLLGHGSRSQAALLLGVDPTAEARAGDVPRSVVAGRWLSAGAPLVDGAKEIALGENLAKLLSAQVGDELVVLMQAADGSTGDERLRVVGLVRTGTAELDRQAAWLRLPEAAWLAALDGQAHEVVVRIERGAGLDGVAGAVREAVSAAGGPALAVRTWEELAPDLRQLIDLTRLTMLVLYAIVYLIAALGVVNTQRMAALERRREFAVMMAVGVTPRRLAGLVIVEAVLLSAFGAALGAGMGWALSAYHAHAGLDLAAFGSQGFSYGGVTFASRVYFVVRPATVVLPALGVLAVGVLCGIWPAIASARVDLARAISGRT